ncbi:MAG: hypothetical protein NC181_03635 [Clostridium sp.]|nr:hypothetical protein [Clostridium sp.]MCM1444396.1 hypothetical protein [Candidatus Amulumruptor caecigallinarius]
MENEKLTKEELEIIKERMKVVNDNAIDLYDRIVNKRDFYTVETLSQYMVSIDKEESKDMKALLSICDITKGLEEEKNITTNSLISNIYVFLNNQIQNPIQKQRCEQIFRTYRSLLPKNTQTIDIEIENQDTPIRKR